MFDENGFRNHRTQSSRLGDAENGRNEMDEEDNQIAHGRIVTSEEDDDVWPELEFATHTTKLLSQGEREERVVGGYRYVLLSTYGVSHRTTGRTPG
jgi:hypothetical protein